MKAMQNIHTFNCPNCGGNIEIQSRAPFVQCPYCESSVALPEPIQQANADAETKQTVIRAKRWLVWIILLAVVLPTCLGIVCSLAGGVLGVLGPLIAALLPFVAQP